MKGDIKKSGIFFDTEPKLGSDNAVTSDGIFKAIAKGGSDYDDTYIRQAIEIIESKIPIDATSLNKMATSQDVQNLENELLTKAESATVTALSERVTQNESDISDLQTDIATKAESATVTALSERVTQNESDISDLQTDIATKAESATVTALSERVTQNESDISALKTADIEIRQTLSYKLGKADFDDLKSRFNNFGTKTQDVSHGYTTGQSRWYRLGTIRNRGNMLFPVLRFRVSIMGYMREHANLLSDVSIGVYDRGISTDLLRVTRTDLVKVGNVDFHLAITTLGEIYIQCTYSYGGCAFVEEYVQHKTYFDEMTFTDGIEYENGTIPDFINNRLLMKVSEVGSFTASFLTS